MFIVILLLIAMASLGAYAISIDFDPEIAYILLGLFATLIVAAVEIRRTAPITKGDFHSLEIQLAELRGQLDVYRHTADSMKELQIQFAEFKGTMDKFCETKIDVTDWSDIQTSMQLLEIQVNHLEEKWKGMLLTPESEEELDDLGRPPSLDIQKFVDDDYESEDEEE